MEYSGNKQGICNSNVKSKLQCIVQDGKSFDSVCQEPDDTSYQTTNSDLENVNTKISLLKQLLEQDPKAADLKWSFFVAACNTYRFDNCLRPFPPMYIKNHCKDIESLRKEIELMPPLAIIFQELHQPEVYKNYSSTIDLLYWVLIQLRDPHLKSVDKKNYESILKKVPSEMPAALPNLIYQVVNMRESGVVERWKTAVQNHSTLYAYHGSRLENFHSILHYGLQQNMCKKSLFGEGIYLSSELSVCLPYSRIGYGWGGSVLGSNLSCVALCELIDHPQIKKGDVNSVGGKIPDKYYLVTNSDLVRVRYLLIYSQNFIIRRNPADNIGFLTWFKQHKLLTFVLGYVVLLASVGLTHNKQVEKYYRLLVQKAGFE